MTIKDLRISITEMDKENALNLVLERRDSRVTPKKRKKSSSKKKQPMTLEEIIETMNSEQAAAYLAKLKKRHEADQDE